ncbi:hypothetical protein PHEL85_0501 [Polaribacter sp. Hel1_85]|nr:hypothetical protein PHEL85_0501 [Polaribacter sp. Hel1_85]
MVIVTSPIMSPKVFLFTSSTMIDRISANNKLIITTIHKVDNLTFVFINIYFA